MGCGRFLLMPGRIPFRASRTSSCGTTTRGGRARGRGGAARCTRGNSRRATFPTATAETWQNARGVRQDFYPIQKRKIKYTIFLICRRKKLSKIDRLFSCSLYLVLATLDQLYKESNIFYLQQVQLHQATIPVHTVAPVFRNCNFHKSAINFG